MLSDYMIPECVKYLNRRLDRERIERWWEKSVFEGYFSAVTGHSMKGGKL